MRRVGPLQDPTLRSSSIAAAARGRGGRSGRLGDDVRDRGSDSRHDGMLPEIVTGTRQQQQQQQQQLSGSARWSRVGEGALRSAWPNVRLARCYGRRLNHLRRSMVAVSPPCLADLRATPLDCLDFWFATRQTNRLSWLIWTRLGSIEYDTYHIRVREA